MSALNAQHVVTPTQSKVVKGSKTSFLNNATMTPAQAIEVALDYGKSMAGLDGRLTNALVLFHKNEEVIASMKKALNVGYLIRTLNVDKTEAGRIYDLKKHNPNGNNSDQNRTPEQQRVMDTVRVLWHRAHTKAMDGLGVEKPISEKAQAAKAKKIETAQAREEHQKRIEATWEILNPKIEETSDDAEEGADAVDPMVALDAAMQRIVEVARQFYNGNAKKFTGDRAAAWREWLAAAPK